MIILLSNCTIIVTRNEFAFISETVRETEEYSCSEEEAVVVEEKVQATKGTKGSPMSTETKPTVSTLKTKAATKQGSIMSFFGKK